MTSTDLQPAVPSGGPTAQGPQPTQGAPQLTPRPPAIKLTSRNFTPDEAAKFDADTEAQLNAQQHQELVQRASQFRESHPWKAAAYDVLRATGEMGTTIAEETTNLGVGAFNWVARPRNNPVQFDLRRALGQDDFQKALDESAAWYNPIARARDIAHIAGWVEANFGTGGAGAGKTLVSGGTQRVFQALTELPSLARQAFTKMTGMSKAAPLLARGIGFGAEQALAAQPGNRLEAGLWGAVTLPAFDGMSAIVRRQMARWVLSGAAPEYVEAADNWIKKNVTDILPNESPGDFNRRATQAWVDAGSPGADPKLWRRALSGSAIYSTEGALLTLLDPEMRHKEYEALSQGRWADALGMFVENTATNALGMKVAKWAGDRWAGKIPPDLPYKDYQTQQPSREPVDTATPVAAPAGEETLPTTEKAAAGGETKPAEPAQPTLKNPNLERLGVEPVLDEAGKPTGEHSLRGTDMLFRVHPDGTVKPNDRMAKVLGADGKLSAEDFESRLEKILLLDHYAANHSLPGEPAAIGVHMEPAAVEGEAARLHTIVAGIHYSKDAGNENAWKAEGKAQPTVAPEAVSPTQQQAISALDQLASVMKTQDPLTVAVVQATRHALATVDGARNTQIGKLADALLTGQAAQLMGAAGGDPEHQERAMLEIAHMGVSKDPQVATQDFVANASRPTEQERLQRRAIAEASTKAEGTESVSASPQEAKALLGRAVLPESELGQKLQKIAAGKRAGRVEVPAATFQSMAATQERLGQRDVASGAPEAIERTRNIDTFLKKAASEFGVSPEPETKAVTEQERGQLDKANSADSPQVDGTIVMHGGIPQLQKLLPAMKWLGRLIKGGLIDPFRGDLVARYGRATGDESFVTDARKAIQAGHKLEKTVEGKMQELRDLINLKGAEGAALRDELQSPIEVGNARVALYHAHMDGDIRRFLTSNGVTIPELSPKAKRVVELANDIRYETGKWFEDAGAVYDDGTKITADKERRRLPRQWTDRGLELLTSRDPNLIKTLAELNNITPSEASREITALNGRGLLMRDAMESGRKLKIVPDAILRDGKWEKILDTRPGEHTAGMVDAAAGRVGYGTVFGWDRPTEGEEGAAQEELAGSLKYPELPMTSYKRVLDIQNTYGQAAARLAVDAIRAMNGMPVEGGVFARNTAAAEGLRGFNLALGVYKSLKLSLSWATRFTKPMVASAYLGVDRVGKAAADIFEAMRTGQWTEMQKQLSQEGLMHYEPVGREMAEGSSMEEAQSKVGFFRDLFGRLTLQHFSQQFIEAQVALAGKSAIADWQAGNGTSKDAAFLRQMGYSPAVSEAIIRGEASPEIYDQVKQRMVPWMTAGGRKSMAEKSGFQTSRLGNSLFAYQTYANARVTQIAETVKGLHDAFKREGSLYKALTSGEGKLAARFGASLGVSGLAILTLARLLREGVDGVAAVFREASEDPLELAKDVAGTMTAHWMGTPAVQAALGNDATVGKTLLNSVAPFAMIHELSQYASAAVAHAPELGGQEQLHNIPQVIPFIKYDQSNPYYGLGFLESTAKFVQTLMPIAKTEPARMGLAQMGIGALGGQGVDLERSINELHRWQREFLPSGAGSPDETPGNKFTENMRLASNMLNEGKGMGDPTVRQALMDAVQAPEGGWKKVADSLLARRLLNGISQDPQRLASLQRFMGDDFAQIQAHDRILEALASWARR